MARMTSSHTARVVATAAPSFPYLGISRRGVVVLFTAPKTGTVLVKGDSGFNVGDERVKFDMNAFSPFRGSVTVNTDY